MSIYIYISLSTGNLENVSVCSILLRVLFNHGFVVNRYVYVCLWACVYVFVDMSMRVYGNVYANVKAKASGGLPPRL